MEPIHRYLSLKCAVLSFICALYIIGALTDTVKVPIPMGAAGNIMSTTSIIVYHPHKHLAAVTSFLLHQPIVIMLGNSSCKYGHFGCVSLSETLLITIESLWLLFSWSGITLDTAMAIMLPS